MDAPRRQPGGQGGRRGVVRTEQQDLQPGLGAQIRVKEGAQERGGIPALAQAARVDEQEVPLRQAQVPPAHHALPFITAKAVLVGRAWHDVQALRRHAVALRHEVRKAPGHAQDKIRRRQIPGQPVHRAPPLGRGPWPDAVVLLGDAVAA